MTSDPRIRNEAFDASSMERFFDQYRERLNSALKTISVESLSAAAALVQQAGSSRAHIYAIGNGGSAAIVDHLCCDWTKGTDVTRHRPIMSTALTANMPLYSALANDFGFNTVFERQLDYFAKSGDVLVAVSSSGNSENILLAAEKAKSMGIKVIGMTGFDGGRLRSIADIALHVQVDNYGIIEDAHQTLMHVIAQFITAQRMLDPNSCITS